MPSARSRSVILPAQLGALVDKLAAERAVVAAHVLQQPPRLVRGRREPAAGLGVGVAEVGQQPVVDGLGARGDQHLVHPVQRQHIDHPLPVRPVRVRGGVAVVGVVEGEAVRQRGGALHRGGRGGQPVRQRRLVAGPRQMGPAGVLEVPVHAGQQHRGGGPGDRDPARAGRPPGSGRRRRPGRAAPAGTDRRAGAAAGPAPPAPVRCHPPVRCRTPVPAARLRRKPRRGRPRRAPLRRRSLRRFPTVRVVTVGSRVPPRLGGNNSPVRGHANGRSAAVQGGQGRRRPSAGGIRSGGRGQYAPGPPDGGDQCSADPHPFAPWASRARPSGPGTVCRVEKGQVIGLRLRQGGSPQHVTAVRETVRRRPPGTQGGWPSVPAERLASPLRSAGTPPRAVPRGSWLTAPRLPQPPHSPRRAL